MYPSLSVFGFNSHRAHVLDVEGVVRQMQRCIFFHLFIFSHFFFFPLCGVSLPPRCAFSSSPLPPIRVAHHHTYVSTPPSKEDTSTVIFFCVYPRFISFSPFFLFSALVFVCCAALACSAPRVSTAARTSFTCRCPKCNSTDRHTSSLNEVHKKQKIYINRRQFRFSEQRWLRFRATSVF